MDAKICDICGATYLAPVTYHEQIIHRYTCGW